MGCMAAPKTSSWLMASVLKSTVLIWLMRLYSPPNYGALYQNVPIRAYFDDVAVPVVDGDSDLCD